MTLHKAIIKLLSQSRRALTAAEIAKELNLNQWYEKKDKTLITSTQISARVNKYHYLFKVDRLVLPQQIKLPD